MLSDTTQSLTARGNATTPAPAAGTANPPTPSTPYLRTYRPDDTLTGAPNATVTDPSATTCTSSGAPTGNTGLRCETDAPTSAGVTTPVGVCQGSGPIACTLNTYDNYGQKVTTRSPKLTSEGAGAACGNTANTTNLSLSTRYVYYQDSDADLTGHTSAGGWLKAVVDPCAPLSANAATSAASHFVAFGYDPAGNRVAVWDRTGTDSPRNGGAPVTVAQYPQVAPGDGALQHAATAAYGSATAPWRYLTGSSTPMGESTADTVDREGNKLAVTSPNGNTTTSTYDPASEVLSTTTPLGATGSTGGGTIHLGYDGFGNKTTQIDADAHRTQWVYDSVNRLIEHRVARTTTGSSALGCTPVTGDAFFPGGTAVCRTGTGYDGVDDVINSQDALQQNTTRSYDGAGRLLSTTAPRGGNNGISSTTTRTNYDADGNAVDACTARQQTESGTTGCTPSSVYATHTTYDPAGKASAVTTYRDARTPLVTTRDYDADGNPLTVTDARASSAGTVTGVTCPGSAAALSLTGQGGHDDDPAHTTLTCYDLLDRKTLSAAPRTTGSAPTRVSTRWAYSPAGQVIARIDPPGDANQARITDTAYDYDGRSTDTVVGASSAATTAASAASAPAGTPDAVTGAGTVDPTAAPDERTHRVYDADGDVTAVITPRGYDATAGAPPAADFTESISYDADDRPVTDQSPRYSDADKASGSTQATECPAVASYAGGSTPVGVCSRTIGYDAVGNVLTETAPSATGNRTVSYAYTDDNLVAGVGTPDPSDPSAAGAKMLTGGGGTPLAESFGYDSDGRRTTSTDLPGSASARTSSTTYTADGLVSSVSSPSGAKVSTPTPTSCDPSTRDTTATHVTTTSFDAAGEPVSVTVGAGTAAAETTATSFTADGLKATSTDGLGQVTRYGYDGDANPTTVTPPTASAHEYANSQGLAITTTSYTPDNLVSTLSKTITFDGSGTPLRVRTTSYGYDPAGRKLQAHVTETSGSASTDGGTQQFGYYADDLLAVQVGRNPSGDTSASGRITSSYDLAGDTTSTADSTYTNAAASTAVRSSYYLDGLVHQVTDGKQDTTYTYNGIGEVTGRTDKNSITTGARGADTPGSGNNSTYSYNPAGLLLTVYATGHQGTWTFGYDQLGRQTGWTQPSDPKSQITGAELQRR